MIRTVLASLAVALAGMTHPGIANADDIFCSRYAKHAVSMTSEAESRSCGFSGDRWSTDEAFHLNRCLGTLKDNITNPTGYKAAKDFFDREDLQRINDVIACRDKTAAAPVPAPAMPTEEMVCQGGGMSVSQWGDGQGVLVAYQPASAGANTAMPGRGECTWLNRAPLASEGILSIPLSMGNSSLLVEAATKGGTFRVLGNNFPASNFVEVTSIFGVNIVDSTPLSPGPVDATAPAPAPAPGGGGQQTASICRVPAGTATVVIADPALTQLNVRDKPMGNIIPPAIPEGTQVNVVGSCGVQLNAGIVAGGGNAQPPVLGWCAISSPQIGCVKDDFLVAGIPAGGQVGAPGTAGLAANQPQAAAVAAPTFTGLWNAEAQGSPYTITLEQNGNGVTGSYSGGGSDGQITGTVSGNVLRFQWSQPADQLIGAGKFTLSADGSSFTGSYTLGTNPDVADGSWNGTRR